MGLIEQIKSWDTSLFLYLNGKHNAFFDLIMSWASSRTVWIPFYVLLLFLIIREYNKKTWIILAGVAVMITLSDQLSVQLFKDVFLRYRPCYNLVIKDMVHMNTHSGGLYGFVSSHAANSFAIAAYFSVLLRKRYPYFPILMFFWATLISYSRIYNGVHYPADVVVGALLGMVIAFPIAFSFLRWEKRNTTGKNFQNENHE